MSVIADQASAALPDSRELGLWAGAGAVMLALHVFAGMSLFSAGPAAEMPPALEEALEIELAPLTISAPESVQSESVEADAPAEEAEPVSEATEVLQPATEQAEPAPAEEVAAEAPEPSEPVINQAVEAAEPEPTEIMPAEAEPTAPVREALLEEVVPEEAEPVESAEVAKAPEAMIAEEVFPSTPEVVLSLPQPRPLPEDPKPVMQARTQPPRERPKQPAQESRRTQETRPPEKARKLNRERPPAVTAERAKEPAPRQTKSPAKAQARAGARSSESREARAAQAPSVSPARWQSQVVARINRFKRKPRGTSESGTVAVRFTISDSGAVTGARVSRSSGNAALDQAAVGIVQRASPVPAPPSGVNVRTLTVPIRFDL